MSPKPFVHKPPKVTDFTPLVSKIPELLRSQAEKQLQQDREGLNRPLALEGASRASVLAARDALYATIDALQQAKRTLDALRTYFDAAEEHATQQLFLHHALLSPIRRLPNEVLQLIFVQVHAALPENDRFNPITTQVCSYWRQAAEATPFLWSSIDVDLTTPEGVEAQLVGAETRFQRARDELVCFRLSQRRSAFASASSNKKSIADDSAKDSKHLVAAVEFLVKHRDRLESITIMPHDRRCDVAHHLASQCQPPMDIRFKNLKALRISFKAPNLSESQIQALCNASPALETLHSSVVPQASTIRWENITELKGRMGLEAFGQLSSRARRLQRANIYALLWSFIQPHTPITYAFDCLTSLSLRQISTNCLGKLATMPPPPALRHLFLCDSTSTKTYVGGDRLISFLKAWGPELEYFASWFVVSQKELKTALQAMPKLQGVRLLADHPIPSNIFTLLPALTHLEFHVDVHEEKEETVRKLLSRPLKPKSLKRFALRSVAFYPTLSANPNEDGLEELPESTKERWERLSQELTAVGLHLYEHRSLKAYCQRSAEFGFNSEFFKDRGLLSFV